MALASSACTDGNLNPIVANPDPSQLSSSAGRGGGAAGSLAAGSGGRAGQGGSSGDSDIFCPGTENWTEKDKSDESAFEDETIRAVREHEIACLDDQLMSLPLLECQARLLALNLAMTPPSSPGSMSGGRPNPNAFADGWQALNSPGLGGGIVWIKRNEPDWLSAFRELLHSQIEDSPTCDIPVQVNTIGVGHYQDVWVVRMTLL